MAFQAAPPVVLPLSFIQLYGPVVVHSVVWFRGCSFSPVVPRLFVQSVQFVQSVFKFVSSKPV